MTHREIQTLPDGTRKYRSGHRYKPVALEDRKYGINRPDDPRAVRFHTRWFVPLELLDDDARTMPETLPDEAAYEHMSTNLLCRCGPCTRPQAQRWRNKWLKENGLRPRPASAGPAPAPDRP